MTKKQDKQECGQTRDCARSVLDAGHKPKYQYLKNSVLETTLLLGFRFTVLLRLLTVKVPTGRQLTQIPKDGTRRRR